MEENLYPQLEQILAPQSGTRHDDALVRQSFREYRRSRPARETAVRRVLYLSRVGEWTAAQEAVVTATAEYLAIFFDLPVRRGADFDPAGFRAWGIRQHPRRGHSQLLTDYILHEALGRDRPEDALVCMAVTAWDLGSDDYGGEIWGSVFGEALPGHAGIWSLRYLGNPADGANALRRCLKRSCAVASHEALHVVGLDHCDDLPCNMRGAACLSGPLHLCPSCLRKLCWNRQLDLLPYLRRLKDWLSGRGLTEAAQPYQRRMALLQERPAR